MTIAVDFDGVIHAYSRGWADGSIYDPPMPGALEGLRALMQQDAVFIFTTRPAIDVAMWLEKRGFSTRFEFDGTFWNDRGVLLVTNRKLAAVAYLDDRAVRFTNWDQALADLGPKPAASSPTTAGSCAHCPDGHTPADRGSQPWTAYVGPERDGDGQPMTIHVARSAGAHVAESDAEWIRQRLNPPERPREPQPRPYTGRLGRGA